MERYAQIERETKETKIQVMLNLDKSGEIEIDTGVGFFDHMLTSFAVHSGFSLKVKATGDLQVDCHHTVEDVGIVLGQCFEKAIGNKCGITRFASAYIPMDEALGFCCIDISSRPYLVFNAGFKAPVINTYDTQMTKEFFTAFANNAKITLHISKIYGDNDHHVTESLFKAFSIALKNAVSFTNSDSVPSSKGVL